MRLYIAAILIGAVFSQAPGGGFVRQPHNPNQIRNSEPLYLTGGSNFRNQHQTQQHRSEPIPLTRESQTRDYEPLQLTGVRNSGEENQHEEEPVLLRESHHEPAHGTNRNYESHATNGRANPDTTLGDSHLQNRDSEPLKLTGTRNTDGQAQTQHVAMGSIPVIRGSQPLLPQTASREKESLALTGEQQRDSRHQGRGSEPLPLTGVRNSAGQHEIQQLEAETVPLTRANQPRFPHSASHEKESQELTGEQQRDSRHQDRGSEPLHLTGVRNSGGQHEIQQLEAESLPVTRANPPRLPRTANRQKESLTLTSEQQRDSRHQDRGSEPLHLTGVRNSGGQHEIQQLEGESLPVTRANPPRLPRTANRQKESLTLTSEQQRDSRQQDRGSEPLHLTGVRNSGGQHENQHLEAESVPVTRANPPRLPLTASREKESQELTGEQQRDSRHQDRGSEPLHLTGVRNSAGQHETQQLEAETISLTKESQPRESRAQHKETHSSTGVTNVDDKDAQERDGPLSWVRGEMHNLSAKLARHRDTAPLEDTPAAHQERLEAAWKKYSEKNSDTKNNPMVQDDGASDEVRQETEPATSSSWYERGKRWRWWIIGIAIAICICCPSIFCLRCR